MSRVAASLSFEWFLFVFSVFLGGIFSTREWGDVFLNVFFLQVFLGFLGLCVFLGGWFWGLLLFGPFLVVCF